MTNSGLCIGLNYGSDLAGSDVDASNMAGLAGHLGIDNVETLTDTNGSVVTRDDVLNSLRSMVENAEPGDNLLFSFSGMGGQMAGGDGEADGQNEYLAVSDGVVTDDEIRAILADLPAGVNCTMVMDAGHTGSIGDLDLSGAEIAGNVVCLSAAGDAANALMGDAMGSPFTNAVVNVMTSGEQAGVSWADAAALVDEELGNSEPTVVASANRAELLFQPAFGAAGEAASGQDAARDLVLDAVAEKAMVDADEEAEAEAEAEHDAAPTMPMPDPALAPAPEPAFDPVNSASLEDNETRIQLDLDGDGRVDVLGYHDHTTGDAGLLFRYGRLDPKFVDADMNGDGLVDQFHVGQDGRDLVPFGVNVAEYVDAQAASLGVYHM
ncbi:hypothetical protein H9P43_007118 [Blastocladiella emersonii ATCC 22665]|nr:hypothetical protein H9P43_007118 [Blastocladiella emersonii ATCC 22665]